MKAYNLILILGLSTTINTKFSDGKSNSNMRVCSATGSILNGKPGLLSSRMQKYDPGIPNQPSINRWESVLHMTIPLI